MEVGDQQGVAVKEGGKEEDDCDSRRQRVIGSSRETPVRVMNAIIRGFSSKHAKYVRTLDS